MVKCAGGEGYHRKDERLNLDPFLGRIRKPVRRRSASRNMLLILLAFALSVAGTRLFLELTGYPQLGGGELHIAHVLWGGLLLFTAALLPLIIANRWAYTWAAVLAGLGVGLFIDEVGKFITQSNDYFYPAAAPIIYAFFLLTVILYLQLRRPEPSDPRSELYRALDSLEEVLDRDLEIEERQSLETSLSFIADYTEDPALARLALSLLDFLASSDVRVTQAPPTFFERVKAGLHAFQKNVLTRKRLSRLLVIGFVLAALFPLYNFTQLLRAFGDAAQMEAMLSSLLTYSPVASPLAFTWYVVRTLLEGTVGVLLLIAAMLLLLRVERASLTIAFYALLLALTIVDLLVFYFEQFSTIVFAVLQLLLFLGGISYRRRFLQTDLRQSSLPSKDRTD